ncbi:uncharacterized protein sS8_1557 [Methylocaldum marinum]|uniref:Uncharacterized protein n=1 Tax=Methylocaldum marinum TaxID=1432792 RepID=A0A250KPC3_9GAMM|nr:hypothetical protein [Methylocaldum marinum]BBA33515.1 uncharacterized protein sS8_1557 [Methylocaldum marinum]
MTASTWRIGQWLNAVQSTFVGLLRILSIPIVLSLSVAEGYNTCYGLSYFIPQWIALIMTIAVQSMIVICTLELAGMRWRANPMRYLSVLLSLLVALIVSISFAYFRFYEFSQRDAILLERQTGIVLDANRYIEDLVGLKSRLIAAQQKRVELASDDATRAYLGTHPGMQGQIGKGKVWGFYNEILQNEEAKLKQLNGHSEALEKRLSEVRSALQEFLLMVNDAAAYERLIRTFQDLQGEAEILASNYGTLPIEAPRFGSYAEFSLGITPSFAMWKNISWFTLALAAMVDFFILFLSYRLESTAPGPLSEDEKELAYLGLRQFGEFTINENDELEFVIEKTELERARRYSDWSRMFSVAFLLNRGYLRKINDKSVEFAPNLYPIIAERLKRRQTANPTEQPANQNELNDILKRKGYV